MPPSPKEFKQIIRFLGSSGFRNFQLQMANTWYSELQSGYRKGEFETDLVKRLVISSNGKGYKALRLAAKFIHGKSSEVSFDIGDKPTSCELGDMLIVSVVTDKKKRFIQRLCFIQNKKDKQNKRTQSWDIKPEQLYLLKNFPLMTGKSGILSGHKDVIFSNITNCLGAYGLLKSPGDMIFASAKLIAEFTKNKKSLNSKDISYIGDIGIGSIFPNHWAMIYPALQRQINLFLLNQISSIYGIIPWYHGWSVPIFGNTIFARDIIDIVKAWTQINIGECTFIDGYTIDHTADLIGNDAFRAVGLSDFVDIPESDDAPFVISESGMLILAAHIEISQ